MSNKEFSQESLIFQFVSSYEFIETLNEKNLEPEEHNLLLSVHLLAIGFNTTGISDGGVRVNYSQKLGPVKEWFERPDSNFHFYTTSNALIEGSRNCSRSRISLKNKFFRTNYTYEFRDFCTEYFNKYAKNIDLSYLKEREEQGLFPLKGKRINTVDERIEFRLWGRKKNSEEGQKYAYEAIVASNKTVKSYAEGWYLERELKLNENTAKKKVAKL